jgi:ubiquinol oxidase
MKNNFPMNKLDVHHIPKSFADYLAYGVVKCLRFIADSFFANRYGHRAVVLETVAGVPGMVGGMLQHLKSLRRCKDDGGWIKILLEEAENERMHLMTFIEIAQPNWFERLLIVIVQMTFFAGYFILYVVSPKVSHRLVSYLEEEAVYSYTQYLAEVENGKVENIPAPAIAIKHWNLPPDTRLKDLIIIIRNDEAGHRDKNHEFAQKLSGK